MTYFQIKVTWLVLLVSAASRYGSKALSFGFMGKVIVNSNFFFNCWLLIWIYRSNLAHFVIFYLTLHQKEFL